MWTRSKNRWCVRVLAGTSAACALLATLGHAFPRVLVAGRFALRLEPGAVTLAHSTHTLTPDDWTLDGVRAESWWRPSTATMSMLTYPYSPATLPQATKALALPLWPPTALLLAAALLIRWRFPGAPVVHNACPACGYDMNATPSRPCPECGWRDK